MRLLKALCTAQLATVVDFVLTVLLASVAGIYYVVATSVGAVAGGVTNCMMNYRWVFPGSNRSKWQIAARYFLVWSTSIALNVLGTYLLTENLRGRSWVLSLMGMHTDYLYVLSKVLVAVLVALLWNYQMQRHYVYSPKEIKQKE